MKAWRMVLVFLLLGTALQTLGFAASDKKKETVTAKSEPEKAGAVGDVAPDPVSVTVTGDAFNRVGQPLFVTFAVNNVSGDALLLKNVSFEVDGLQKELFQGQSTECKLQQLGEVNLKKAGGFQQSCRFEMKSLDSDWSLGSLRTYLFANNVRFVVAVSVSGDRDYRYYPTVVVNASEVSIFAGGIFGALLLALFVWVHKLIVEPRARLYWGRNLGYTALLAIRGGIMAIIALLIGKTTQGSGSPVALTVIDFAGGVMIGIFSYPLASWMASTLKIESVQSQPLPSGSHGAPGKTEAAPSSTQTPTYGPKAFQPTDELGCR